MRAELHQQTARAKTVFGHLKGDVIWTCTVGFLFSPSVVFISFAKKLAIGFRYFFSQVLKILFQLKFLNKKWGSSCSFKRKGAFISLSSLV